MPNKENIRKWVEALRSGDYKQTLGSLRRVDAEGEATGYCCLGVACEISPVVEPYVVTDMSGIGGYVNPTDPEDKTSSVLPVVVQGWLGLDSDYGNPAVKVTDKHDGHEYPRSLTALNDADGFTFEEIADAIEASYLTDDVAA